MLPSHLLTWFTALNGWWQAIIVAGGVVTALAAINRYALRPFYLRVLKPGTLGLIAGFRALPQIVELMNTGLDRLDALTQQGARTQQGVDENTRDIEEIHRKVDDLATAVQQHNTPG